MKEDNMSPNHQIYLKRMSRRQKMSEAITVFFALSIALLMSYMIIKHVERINTKQVEVKTIAQPLEFEHRIVNSSGMIRIKGIKETAWYVFSNEAKDAVNINIQHLEGNKYVLTYSTGFVATYHTMILTVINSTITFSPEEVFIATNYINLTKDDAGKYLVNIETREALLHGE